MRADPIRRFLAEQDPPTPCLVVDTDVVAARAREFRAAFPGALIRYAVKANPAPPVLDALVAAGAGFDVAGPAELALCLARGAEPADIAYGNPIKKPRDIAFAFEHGVREFTSDAPDDVDHLGRHAPGSAVSIRVVFDAPDSVTPFGRKFGCEPAEALDLVLRAAALGLRPGIAFHVGSQQPDVTAWEIGIATAAKLFAEAGAQGVAMTRLNLGGGFATAHRTGVPSLDAYATTIAAALDTHFPRNRPELLLEPGRVLVADAGLLRTEVVLVAHRGERRWVYLDIGRYNGLAEAENEAIAYRFEPVDPPGGPSGPVVLAGPTCDGDDVLYQRTPYQLPLALRTGDRLDVPGTGAYTASYASVGFNGIEPLRTYCLGRWGDV
ncbi:type III PLP-dependent enzyme [Amycolatopsis sp. FBCC-B4732]|uniref:type III PLP-dependent enzyme n=1 Tax=Amycolatopsis sp. FBCC-B4732 TaxID=3079339 RepID=UPI001FF3C4A3|nr:type III PLP-dependent enzyme [Amycolatopsis sp. FBCC-B4732]UOX91273.1 type III PLP-dependent enzyme [Amycolatopsis sp. FBCC-B4732]